MYFSFEIWSYISQTSKNTSTFFHPHTVFELKISNLQCSDLMFPCICSLGNQTAQWTKLCYVSVIDSAEKAWSIITWKKMLVWSTKLMFLWSKELLREARNLSLIMIPIGDTEGSPNISLLSSRWGYFSCTCDLCHEIEKRMLWSNFVS